MASRRHPTNTWKRNMVASKILWTFIVFIFALCCPLTHAKGGIASLGDIHAIYSLSVLNNSLVSTEHVLCTPKAEPTDAVRDTRCPSGFGKLVNRLLYVSTHHPPGILPISSRWPVPYEESLDTVDFHCPQMEDKTCSSNSNDDSAFDDKLPGILGISVASPCCGSPYSTFFMNVSSRTLFQAANLDKWAHEKGSPIDFVHRLWNEAILPPGARGMPFPVVVFLCKARVSNIASRVTGLAVTGLLSAVISTNTAVTSVIFPRELLEAISGWIASSFDAQTSLNDVNACSFVTRPRNRKSLDVAEEYMLCNIDPELRYLLPVVEVRPQLFHLMQSNVSMRPLSSFFIDLSRLVNADGQLQMESLGSISEVGPSCDSGHCYPRIVIGAMFIEDASIFFSRGTGHKKGGLSLPVIIMSLDINSKWSGLQNEELETSCVVPKKCADGEVHIMSINRCGSPPECDGLLFYHYNVQTMKCEVVLWLLAPFCALFLAVILSDLAVLLVRRRLDKMMMESCEEIMEVKNR